MARYVVAVSGGIDSVALLHMMQSVGDHELIVAHVDHGIRDDSADDERFVRGLARQYDLPYVSKRVELGAEASEDTARQVRYDFLRSVAKDHDARIVTAHHADDVVETVAINLHRGTGWRGLATHGSDVARPLLGHTKGQLRQYAHRHGLEWHEDSTNASDRYLRNRIRRHVAGMDTHTKKQILVLRDEQRKLRKMIQDEVERLVGEGPTYDRYFFTHIPRAAAIECLRHITKGKLTRPQMNRALLAIKTAAPGTIYEAGNGVSLTFTTRNFSLALIKY